MAGAVLGCAAADFEKGRVDYPMRQAGQLGRIRGGKVKRDLVYLEAEFVLQNSPAPKVAVKLPQISS